MGMADDDDVDMQLQATQSRDQKILSLRTQLEEQEVEQFDLVDG